MEPISVLLFVFSGMVMLIGVLIASGETGLVRSFSASKVRDRKAYAKYLGRSVMRVAMAPLIGGVLALLIPVWMAGLIAAVLFVVFMVVVAKGSKEYYR